MAKTDNSMKGWGNVLKIQGAAAGERHQITPDLKFETLLQESDLRPSQREKFTNAVTEVLKAKNLDYSDIRLRDLVNVSYYDLHHSGLSRQYIDKFTDFLKQNGFSVYNDIDDKVNDGRFVMRDHPEIKGSDLQVSDILMAKADDARTERIKNITLDTPLDQFLADADIRRDRKVYYDKIIEVFNESKKFPGDPIKDLSEVKVRDLEGIHFGRTFQEGEMVANYNAVRNLFLEAGIIAGGKGLGYIHVAGKFPDGQNPSDAEMIQPREMKLDELVAVLDKMSHKGIKPVPYQHGYLSSGFMGRDGVAVSFDKFTYDRDFKTYTAHMEDEGVYVDIRNIGQEGVEVGLMNLKKQQLEKVLGTDNEYKLPHPVVLTDFYGKGTQAVVDSVMLTDEYDDLVLTYKGKWTDSDGKVYEHQFDPDDDNITNNASVITDLCDFTIKDIQQELGQSEGQARGQAPAQAVDTEQALHDNFEELMKEQEKQANRGMRI